MEEYYKAFLGIQYDVSSVSRDYQSRIKRYAAYNFYTCTGNPHVLLSNTNGFEYDEARSG